MYLVIKIRCSDNRPYFTFHRHACHIFNNFKAIRCEYKKVLKSTLNIHIPCIQKKTFAHTVSCVCVYMGRKKFQMSNKICIIEEFMNL